MPINLTRFLKEADVIKKLVIVLSALIAALGIGCSDQDFASLSGGGTKTKAKETPEESEEEGSIDFEEPVDPDKTAITTFEFNYTAPEEKVIDYVLVLDNSSSMEVALKNSRSGLASVIDAKIFNDQAKLGMISTMPAVLDNPTSKAIHASIKQHDGVALEPGYLDFARASQFAAFEAANPTLAASNFPIGFCDQGMFSPYDKNANGDLCLDAVMQTSFTPVIVEDGIYSFLHMIKLAGATPLFREDAEVNVIFISDVQAPGVKVAKANAADLLDVATRPTFETLKDAVVVANKVSKITFHSITPPGFVEGCTEQETEFGAGQTYDAVVQASGGGTQNICEPTGYNDFFKKMVTDAQNIKSATVTLDSPAEKIINIKVNGAEFSDFVLAEDGLTVELNFEKLAYEKLAFEITYQLKEVGYLPPDPAPEQSP
jgi:hypothetical protein